MPAGLDDGRAVAIIKWLEFSSVCDGSFFEGSSGGDDD